MHEIVELSEIKTVGVKRAKFTAYRLAISDGSFLFLDSDIIVLDGLSELEDRERLVACADDLSECRMIQDKRRPWPGDPNLEADVFINSGVVYFPRALAGFLENLERHSRDDDLFARYTIDPFLVDNPFLCAYLNKERIPIRFADSIVFNWPGLKRGNTPLIGTQNGKVVNKASGRPMRLLHFAGVPDIDAFIFRLDPDTLGILAAETNDGPVDNLSVLCAGPDAADSLPLDARTVFARVMNYRAAEPQSPNAPAPYIPNRQALISLAMSTAPSTVVWNGLPCGAAYFEPQEYYWLRRAIYRIGAQSILEIGAGYTSIVLNKSAKRMLSVEATSGPWLDDALAHGCEVALVPFDPQSRRFDDGTLQAAIEGHKLQAPDLLFVDSPNGTANRQGAFTQFLELIQPRFIIFHDALRDAQIVYGALRAGRYQFVDCLSSLRGLVMLGRVYAPRFWSWRGSGMLGRADAPRPKSGPWRAKKVEGAANRAFSAEIAAEAPPRRVSSNVLLQRILLRNCDQEEWRSEGENAPRRWRIEPTLLPK